MGKRGEKEEEQEVVRKKPNTLKIKKPHLNDAAFFILQKHSGLYSLFHPPFFEILAE